MGLRSEPIRLRMLVWMRKVVSLAALDRWELGSCCKDMEPMGWVRVKRAKTILFVRCDVEGGATGAELQEEVARLMKRPREEVRLHMLQSGTEQSEGSESGDGSAKEVATSKRSRFAEVQRDEPLKDQGLANDSELFAVFRAADGTWESVGYDATTEVDA
ncbi:hypothetical protein FVE85_4103 [Porphyridium purpureum]|uniref:Uncharacterized protein n=1 Tax=Porphyridium purpureum TaxID=35688 RepID=A0A5J4YS57_PORPP|nr:hypothetical protein FVE85_4103 [Porphyridium purpureum]|eukprot:POR9212..scf229_5